MKITIMPNLTRSASRQVTLKIVDILNAFGASISFPEEYAEAFGETGAKMLSADRALKECDAVIAVGGDGSIIHAAKQAIMYKKPILGVNAGRLAFMAGIEDNELELLSELIGGNYELDKRLMLKTDIMCENEILRTDYCVNDCFITNVEKQRMSSVDVSLNGSKFNEYLCDGLVVATPTGSTAYSLSAGGPVVDPELESIVFTPICPHSLVDRSIIFRPDSIITVASAEDKPLYVSSDGQEPRIVEPGCRVTVTRAEFTADFIRIKTDNFIDILYTKLAQRR